MVHNHGKLGATQSVWLLSHSELTFLSGKWQDLDIYVYPVTAPQNNSTGTQCS